MVIDVSNDFPHLLDLNLQELRDLKEALQDLDLHGVAENDVDDEIEAINDFIDSYERY